jgi:hypothetical protein
MRFACAFVRGIESRAREKAVCLLGYGRVEGRDMQAVVLLVGEPPLPDLLGPGLEEHGYGVVREPDAGAPRILVIGAFSREAAVRRLRERRASGHGEIDTIVCAPFESLAEEDAFVDEHEVGVVPVPVDMDRLLELLAILVGPG